jgi:hypothetical protein
VYLTGRASHERVSYGCASYERASHRHAPYGRVSHRHASHGHVPHLTHRLGPLLLSHPPGSPFQLISSGASRGVLRSGLTLGLEQGEVGADFTNLGTSDPLTSDVPPSATYLALDNYAMLPRLLIARFLPSGVASVPHDLVDDDGRTVSQTSKSRPP